jgi:hypothetical protein
VLIRLIKFIGGWLKHNMPQGNASILKMKMERVVIMMEKAAVAVAMIDFYLCLHVCLN